MAQETISVYNLADLKNKSDDALPNYLGSLGFVQSHAQTDVHLALGFGSVALAGACFAWDLYLGFDATKHWSLAAVVAYALLSAALTYWTYAVGDTVYVGTAPDKTTVTIATKTTKYAPVYAVTATATDAHGKTTTVSFEQPFAAWFDAAGNFVAAPFQALFASSVPAIGQLDPKNVAAASTASPAYSAEMLDILAASTSTSTATATGSSTKATKRRI